MFYLEERLTTFRCVKVKTTPGGEFFLVFECATGDVFGGFNVSSVSREKKSSRFSMPIVGASTGFVFFVFSPVARGVRGNSLPFVLVSGRLSSTTDIKVTGGIR